LLPDGVSRTAFTTDGRESYSNGSSFSDTGKHFGFAILADIVGNFEIAKRA